MSISPFSWQGASIGFLGFNAAIGLEIMKKAYVALSGNGASGPGRKAKSEGAGHILNYLIQLAIVAVWGVFLAKIDEHRVQNIRARLDPGSTAEFINWGILFFAVSIFAWNKLFSDTPVLRQFCIDLMDRVFGRPLEEDNTRRTKRNAAGVKE